MNPIDPNNYEYAGFIFELKGDRMVAKPGQHRAAYKEKHARAALEQYTAEEMQYDADCKERERAEFRDRGEEV